MDVTFGASVLVMGEKYNQFEVGERKSFNFASLLIAAIGKTALRNCSS